MSSAASLLEGKTFFLRSVTPEPASGPFPARICGYVSIRFEPPNFVGFEAINSGGGSYELGEEGRSIRFAQVGWELEALAGLHGDDAEGTLARRYREAEDLLQEKISWKGGWLGLSLLDEGQMLVLKDNEEGTQYAFTVADPAAPGNQTD